MDTLNILSLYVIPLPISVKKRSKIQSNYGFILIVSVRLAKA